MALEVIDVEIVESENWWDQITDYLRSEKRTDYMGSETSDAPRKEIRSLCTTGNSMKRLSAVV